MDHHVRLAVISCHYPRDLKLLYPNCGLLVEDAGVLPWLTFFQPSTPPTTSSSLHHQTMGKTYVSSPNQYGERDYVQIMGWSGNSDCPGCVTQEILQMSCHSPVKVFPSHDNIR